MPSIPFIPRLLELLSNVTITGVADGEVLTYSNANSRWENQAASGASPAGSGSELQFRSDASTFGAVTSSSVTGANVGLEGTVTIDVDDAEAFLVRKDGDAGDVLVVDTSGSLVSVGGTTNPTLQVDSSAASVATGVSITGAAAASGVALAAVSSGANEDLTIDAKGSGDLILQNTATGNVGIGTTSPTSRIHGDVTLSHASNNEIAYTLDYTVNKAAGDSTGLKINMTDTASPGTDLLLDCQVGGTSQLFIDNAGAISCPTTIAFQTGGATRFNLLSGSFSGAIAGSGAILNEDASATNPSLVPDRGYTATGIGGDGFGQYLSLITNNFEAMRLDSDGNHTITSTLDAATGNEVALSLNYTVNKLTSGDSTGLLINMTETNAPGTDLLLDCQVGGTSKFVFGADGNAGIGSTDAPSANGGKVLFLGDNTADPTMGTNTCGVYGKDVTGTVELFTIDEAGNTTQQTPHAADGPAAIYNETPGLEPVASYANLYRGEIRWVNLQDSTKTPIVETFAQYNTRRGLAAGQPGFRVQANWEANQDVQEAKRQSEQADWDTQEAANLAARQQEQADWDAQDAADLAARQQQQADWDAQEAVHLAARQQEQADWDAQDATRVSALRAEATALMEMPFFLRNRVAVPTLDDIGPRPADYLSPDTRPPTYASPSTRPDDYTSPPTRPADYVRKPDPFAGV